MSLIVYFVIIVLSMLYFKGGCWKVTAEILERETKMFYTLFFILLLKMHSFWLLMFVIKLYSHTNIFKEILFL